MSPAKVALLDSPRRRVRYTTLLEAWPDCPRNGEPSKAILEAPADACLEAMAREVDHAFELLADERERANKLETDFNAIRLAARTLARLFDDDEQAQS